MTEHNRSFDEDSKVRMGNYWSRTQDVDEPEPAKFKMYWSSRIKALSKKKRRDKSHV
jgi:hypothetical protein